MTPFSANETQSIVRKAAIGMGYDVGVAEDLGKAAVWLCVRNFDGAQTVLRSIADGPSQTFTRDSARDSECEYLVFKGLQIATGGPGIVDIAASGELPVKIELQGVKFPLLLLGLAGICAGSYGIDITIAAEDGSAAISTDGTAIRGIVPPDGVDLTLTCQLGDAGAARAAYPITTFTCDDETWNSLSKLAAKTYVPASEVSREKGAGAGLTDND